MKQSNDLEISPRSSIVVSSESCRVSCDLLLAISISVNVFPRYCRDAWE